MHSAQGLEFLHKHTLMHLDVKPANILFKRDLHQVVLADFGHTIISGDKGFLDVECGSRGYATPWYVAPELRGNKAGDGKATLGKATPASDIYSWGVTLAVSGEQPHVGGH